MPQLTPEQFNRVRQQWITEAPDGLDEAAFNEGLYQRAFEEEQRLTPYVGKPEVGPTAAEAASDPYLKQARDLLAPPTLPAWQVREQQEQLTQQAAELQARQQGAPDRRVVASMAPNLPTSSPEEQRSFTKALPAAALRLGGPIAGAAIGTGIGAATGPGAVGFGYGGAAIGGILGEAGAQAYERATGQRDEFNYLTPAVAGLLGLPNVPLGRLPGAARFGARLIEGPAVNVGLGELYRRAEGVPTTPEGLAFDATVGLGAGAAVGGAEAMASRTAKFWRDAQIDPATLDPQIRQALQDPAIPLQTKQDLLQQVQQQLAAQEAARQAEVQQARQAASAAAAPPQAPVAAPQPLREAPPLQAAPQHPDLQQPLQAPPAPRSGGGFLRGGPGSPTLGPERGSASEQTLLTGSGGILGAGIGGSQDDENPYRGALLGGLVGAGAGFAGGRKLIRMVERADFETMAAKLRRLEGQMEVIPIGHPARQLVEEEYAQIDQRMRDLYAKVGREMPEQEPLRQVELPPAGNPVSPRGSFKAYEQFDNQIRQATQDPLSVPAPGEPPTPGLQQRELDRMAGNPAPEWGTPDDEHFRIAFDNWARRNGLQAFAGLTAASAMPSTGDEDTDRALRVGLLVASLAPLAMAFKRGQVPQEQLEQALRKMDEVAAYHQAKGRDLSAAMAEDFGPELAGLWREQFAPGHSAADGPRGLFSRLESDLKGGMLQAPGKEMPAEIAARLFKGMPREWKAGSVLSMLEKRGSLKEAEDRGLVGYLRSKGPQTVVSKQELLDFLDSHQNIEQVHGEAGETLTKYDRSTVQDYATPGGEDYRESQFRSPFPPEVASREQAAQTLQVMGIEAEPNFNGTSYEFYANQHGQRTPIFLDKQASFEAARKGRPGYMATQEEREAIEAFLNAQPTYIEHNVNRSSPNVFLHSRSQKFGGARSADEINALHQRMIQIQTEINQIEREGGSSIRLQELDREAALIDNQLNRYQDQVPDAPELQRSVDLWEVRRRDLLQRMDSRGWEPGGMVGLDEVEHAQYERLNQQFREAERELVRLRGELNRKAGPRTHLIEEIQSSAHQDARNTGYHTPGEIPPPSKNDQAFEAAKARAVEVATLKVADHTNPSVQGQLNRAPDVYFEDILRSAAGNGDREAAEALADYYIAHANADETRYKVAPPSHFPLKKVQEWTRLGLKGELLKAAEGGADQVAVTSGAVQAHRYRDVLLRGASDLAYDPVNEVLHVRTPDGREEQFRIGLTGMSSPDSPNLPAVVGDKLARPLLIRGLMTAPEMGGPVTQLRLLSQYPDEITVRALDEAGRVVGERNVGDDHDFIRWVQQNFPEEAHEILFKAEDLTDALGSQGDGHLDIPIGLTHTSKLQVAALPNTEPAWVELDQLTDVGQLGKQDYYDRIVAPQLQEAGKALGLEATTFDHPAMGRYGEGNPALRLTPEARAQLGALGQPTYGGFESFPAGTARLRNEAVGAKQEVRQLAGPEAGIPFTDELGIARKETLGALGGAAVGGVAAGATGPDDQKDLFTRAALGALGGGLIGLGLAGAGKVPTTLERALKAYDQQLPQLARRFRPNTLAMRAKANFAHVKQVAAETVGKALVPFYELKKINAQAYQAAIEGFQTYKNNRFAIPHKVVAQLKQVTEPLKEPAEYELFNRILRLRRDLEGHLRTGSPLESNLDPLIAAQGLSDLTVLASQQYPQVIEAITRHKALMSDIGDELIALGKMAPSTKADNLEYFPEYVLDHIRPKAMTGTRNLGRPAEGYLKFREGGARETLRDYFEATSRYLAETHLDREKDTLVVRLGATYDPRINGQLATGQTQTPPAGYGTFLWPPPGNPRSQEYWLPEPLIDYIKATTSPLQNWEQVYGRANNALKAWLIRASGGAYFINNLVGDSVNVAANTPMLTEWWKLPKQYAKAAYATYLLEHAPGGMPLNPMQQRLMTLAHQAQVENIGTSGASAEIQEQVFRDPQLRKLTIGKGSDPALKKAANTVVSLFKDVSATADLFRTYLENVPRLALYINEIENGRQLHAAQVTRKAVADYLDVTPFEERWLRGKLMPFFTWYKKMAENWMPGLEGTGTVKERLVREVKEPLQALSRGLPVRGPLGKIAKVMPFAVAAAAYNQYVFPEAEHSLEDWERDQPHILVPYEWLPDVISTPLKAVLGDTEKGRVGLLYLGFSGPGNAIARSVGLGGFANRAIDLARGATTPMDEVKQSASQVGEFWSGMLSPALTIPASIVSGQDFRTGRNFYRPEDPLGTKIEETVKGTIGNLPPFGTFLRGAREGATPDEDTTAFLKRLVIGTFAKTVDPQARIANRNMRIMAEGKREGQAQWAQLRGATAVEPVTEMFRQANPSLAIAAYAALGDGANDRTLKAIIVDAAQKMSKESIAWTETAKQLQLMQQHPSKFEWPAIIERYGREAVPPSPFEKDLKEKARAK